MLREYRRTHGISAETHIGLLKRIGWSLDDYEVRLFVVTLISLRYVFSSVLDWNETNTFDNRRF
jgi:hypothetical protein